MPTAQEWLEFFYPNFFENDSVTYALPTDVVMALLVALPWRPKCLEEDQQNQAQAHYAAYVLQFRQEAAKAGISQTETATAVVAGPIIEKQEGTTRVRYSEKTSTSSSSASAIQSQMTGPGTPYAAWFALWGMCTGVDVSTGQIVRRGGIITRYGLPQ